jgi:hypothetical protein
MFIPTSTVIREMRVPVGSHARTPRTTTSYNRDLRIAIFIALSSNMRVLREK